MDTQTLVIGIGLFVLGWVIGRLTAPKEKTTTVYRAVGPGSEVATRTRSGLAEVDPEIEAAIRNGQKIEAIKRYRAIHDTDLKDAKDAVDAIEARPARSST